MGGKGGDKGEGDIGKEDSSGARGSGGGVGRDRDDGGKGGNDDCGVSSIDEGSSDGGSGGKVKNQDLKCMDKDVC